MAVTIISHPIKSSCNWNAAGNPIIYKLRRSDHTYNQVNNNEGAIQVQINGVNLTAYYQVGNTVYVLSSSGGALEIFGEITASAFSGGNTLVTLTVAYSASTGGIINNNSKRTDYKIDIDFKDGDTDLTLLNGSSLSFTPDSYGIITVDASILKNILSAEWNLPATINEVDAEASQAFYISFQEFYDGALLPLTFDDTANIIFAVFAANQIGNPDGSNMLAYYIGDDTKKFLTKFYLSDAAQGLTMWRDWPFTISFIWPDGVSNIEFLREEYDASGAIVSVTVTTLSVTDNVVHRIKIIDVNDLSKRIIIKLVSSSVPGSFGEIFSSSSFVSLWANEDSGTSWSLAGNALIQDLTTLSKILRRSDSTISPSTGKFFRLVFDLTLPNTKQVDILFLGYDNVNIGGTGWETLATSLAIVGDGSAVERTLTSAIITTTRSYTRYGIRIVPDDAVLGDVIIDNVTVSYGDAESITIDLDIEVRDACDYNEDNEVIPEKNPIHLFWKNSVGGDSFWNFDKYHEYTFNYSSGKKAKRIILFATLLTPVQLNALEELNTIGEVYQSPIIDLENTNTINKTAQRVGQQVYIISKDGETKTGVIVMPSSDRQLSRDVTHTFSVDIELPEVIGLE